MVGCRCLVDTSIFDEVRCHRTPPRDVSTTMRGPQKCHSLCTVVDILVLGTWNVFVCDIEGFLEYYAA